MTSDCIDSIIAKYRTVPVRKSMPEADAKLLQQATNEAHLHKTRLRALHKLIPVCGEGVVIRQYCMIEGPKNLQLGNNVYINAGVQIIATAPVIIGNNVGISVGCKLSTIDHAKQTNLYIKRHAPIVIEDYVTIYANVVICKGSHIGHHVVVYASAIVRGTIPPYSIVHANGRVETLTETEWLANEAYEAKQYNDAQKLAASLVSPDSTIVEDKNKAYAYMSKQQLQTEHDMLLRQFEYWCKVVETYNQYMDFDKACLAYDWQKLCIALLQLVDAKLHEGKLTVTKHIAKPTVQAVIVISIACTMHYDLHPVKRRRQGLRCRSA